MNNRSQFQQYLNPVKIRNKMISALIVFLCLAFPMPASSVYLVWDDEQLVGARNVAIQDSYYDVFFREGACIEVFESCDRRDLLTQNHNLASLTSDALLSQTMVDNNYKHRGPGGISSRVFGITNDLVGRVFTPFGLDGNSYAVIANNAGLTKDDEINNGNPFEDSQEREDLPVPIPEPISLVLIGIGLIGGVVLFRPRYQSKEV